MPGHAFKSEALPMTGELVRRASLTGLYTRTAFDAMQPGGRKRPSSSRLDFRFPRAWPSLFSLP